MGSISIACAGLNVGAHSHQASALILPLTLGRNTLVSIAPFTPIFNISVNTSIKIQKGFWTNPKASLLTLGVNIALNFDGNIIADADA